MAYSNKKVENDPTLFPAPQEWMTWVEDLVYDPRMGGTGMSRRIGEGKLRHFHTLADARKSMRWIGSRSQYRHEAERGKFWVDWAIYHWNHETGQWDLMYSGLAGEERDANPLFQRRFKASERQDAMLMKQEDKAIESLTRTLMEVR